MLYLQIFLAILLYKRIYSAIIFKKQESQKMLRFYRWHSLRLVYIKSKITQILGKNNLKHMQELQ